MNKESLEFKEIEERIYLLECRLKEIEDTLKKIENAIKPFVRM